MNANSTFENTTRRALPFVMTDITWRRGALAAFRSFFRAEGGAAPCQTITKPDTQHLDIT